MLGASRFVDGLCSGDREIEEEFIQHFGRRCAALARKGGVPNADAQDVAQDTLIAVVLQLRRGSFRGESQLQLESWLFSILRRKIVDYWRRQNRTVSLDALLSTSEADVMLPVMSHDGIEASVLAQQALDHLRARCRVILVLSSVGGYTIEQIAGLIGGSPGRVGALLAESKHSLRRMLEPSDPYSPKKADGETLNEICAKYFLVTDVVINLSLVRRVLIGIGVVRGYGVRWRSRSTVLDVLSGSFCGYLRLTDSLNVVR